METQPSSQALPALHGRGANAQTGNRFERLHCNIDLEQLTDDERLQPRRVKTEFYKDASQSIIAENDSPDVGFRWSINAYRGCEHGCLYCYARPGHEYFGMNAAIDFESKIMVKENAPALLRQALNKKSWTGDVIALSGVTDCYQPAERHFKLTRGLLQVMSEANQAVGIITKNALVTRDLDILAPMAERNLVHVNLSVTTLDADLARSMEPRTSHPEARLRAIRELAQAGVPVRVMVAPLVPGLNDREIPAILQAASEAGAKHAAYTLVRLPFAVRPIFEEWLARELPNHSERIVALIRSTRDGKMNDAQPGRRMIGQGAYAEQIRQTFKIFRRKVGLESDLPAYDTTQFRPPQLPSGQMKLF